MFSGFGQAAPEQSLEDFLKAEEEAGTRAKFEVEVCLDKKEQLLKGKGQGDKEKAALEARRQAELAKKEELRKARELKIAKEKAEVEAREKAELAKKEELRKARELKIAKEKAEVEARKNAEFAKREELRREYEMKISEKKAAQEANRQIVLEVREKRREAQEARRREKAARIRAEKAAVRLNKAAPAPSLGSRYLCELGISSYRSGRLQEALSEFNKVLIVEPENQTAQKYSRKILKKLAQEQGLAGK